METRAVYPLQGLEVRQLGGRPTIHGKFGYGDLAVLADRGKVRKETIQRGAFAYDLENPLSDIAFLFGHDFSKPLASRRGGSLTFKDTENFLEFVATIPEGAERASHVVDALAMLDAGLATGISPGFRVPPPDVVPDAEELVPEEGNPSVFIRVLKKLRLYELSLVTKPAYAASSAELRAFDLAQRGQDRVWVLP